MKKLTATLVCLIVLSMSALPLTAQTRSRYNHRATTYSSRYDGRYNGDPRYDSNVYQNDSVYTNDGHVYNDNRSVWQKHRNKITTAGGAVAGALLGGLLGGKKGAAIGAITGGAGAAVYTYKIRGRNYRY